MYTLRLVHKVDDTHVQFDQQTGSHMTGAEKVYWGLQQFVFAAKFAACCNSGTIDFNLFKPRCTISIPNDVTFDIPEWNSINQEELVVGALNQLMISLGACAIAVDEGLSSKHGKSSFKNWEKDQSDINSLREVIFLIRSAYAHKMPEVHWHISGPRAKTTYLINTPNGDVQFDANGKNGTKLEISHFGGLRGFIYLVHLASDNLL